MNGCACEVHTAFILTAADEPFYGSKRRACLLGLARPGALAGIPAAVVSLQVSIRSLRGMWIPSYQLWTWLSG